ncbi:hypothetical protein HYC85_007400 [Camellia sinensis]|uniref:K Homology domain-containing protein n=1 Tax=Camellia sinensis TaxID=4442 RepID=A0A7J7HRA3_CAMSI|nr:hypothetical protein HYC85_007400 [Camellia sinensis]
MSSLFPQNSSFSPARTASPHIRTNPDVDSQYLAELLAEHQKLEPFVHVVPICSRLLNQGISGMMSNHGFNDYERLQRGSPNLMASQDIKPNLGGTGIGGWSGHPHELLTLGRETFHKLSSYIAPLKGQYKRRFSAPQGIMDWHAAPGSPSSYIVKRILRLEIPVDSYPNFNFVGRLLGPRGNSLKRVEASTGCRVFIRGKGSIKDPDKEEILRGRPGYEHLNDPLHILVEAELPANIVDVRLRQAREIIEELLKPVDESQDIYKRQQLRELAMLNSNFREESPRPSGSVSPFGSSGMKRAKTGW